MPSFVIIAGGPDSTRSLSQCPDRLPTTIFKADPDLRRRTSAELVPRSSLVVSFASGSDTTGVQWIRSSEVAAQISLSPQYIQYFPLIFVATILPPG